MRYESRKDVPIEETWDLSDIYKNMNEYQKDFQKAEELNLDLSKYENNINNGNDLYEYLVLREKHQNLFKKLYSYAKLNLDIDTKQTASQDLLAKVNRLSTETMITNSFFPPFLMRLKEVELSSYYQECSGLSYFKREITQYYRYKHYTLSEKEEVILSRMEENFAYPQITFSLFNNADIVHKSIIGESNLKIKLSPGTYNKLIKSKNRNLRKDAYKTFYKPYIQTKNTLATLLTANIQNNVTISNLRNFPSALERSLFADAIPVTVYNTLISSTKENISALHEYFKVFKEISDIEDLRAYDLNIQITESPQREVPFNEGIGILEHAFKPLGEEYVSLLLEFRKKRYFDLRETEGKRSGAYNLGVYNVHPFILLNYQDDLSSLFTLAHEVGHGIHSHYSSKNQPPISENYSIFVAEVASTVNEILLIHYFLKNSKDTNDYRYNLNQYINKFIGIYFKQVMLAEFEKTIYELAENKQPLNFATFNSIYEKLFKEYYGETVIIDEEVQYGWSRIPHFYRPFYVYQYATGFAAAVNIAERLTSNDNKFKDDYISFLKAGNTEDPLLLLKKIDIDLTKPNAIESTLSTFERLVVEFKSLKTCN